MEKYEISNIRGKNSKTCLILKHQKELQMIETLIPDINNLKKKRERERYRERISANLSKGVKKNYKIP